MTVEKAYHDLVKQVADDPENSISTIQKKVVTNPSKLETKLFQLNGFEFCAPTVIQREALITLLGAASLGETQESMTKSALQYQKKVALIAWAVLDADDDKLFSYMTDTKVDVDVIIREAFKELVEIHEGNLHRYKEHEFALASYIEWVLSDFFLKESQEKKEQS